LKETAHLEDPEMFEKSTIKFLSKLGCNYLRTGRVGVSFGQAMNIGLAQSTINILAS
jgi:hypothetical protein